MNNKVLGVQKNSDLNLDGTPITNRGVGNTSNQEFSLNYQGFSNNLNQFVLFDWIQCTILSESFDYNLENGVVSGVSDVRYKVIDMFKYLFGLEAKDLVFEYTGVSGYNCCYSYKDIKIMYNQSRPDMGINLLMSGQGCRCFEELKLDYIEFFRKLKQYSSINYNRLDISVDDFTSDYFTLNKLKSYIKHGHVSSKFLSTMMIEKMIIKTLDRVGDTLQFGSRSSNIQVTFYDKMKERQSKNIIVDTRIKYWTRCEIRFRHETAKNCIDKIVQGSSNINDIVKSVLKDYINFKDRSSKDSNVARRPNASWWDDYLENLDNLKITNYLPESTITRKKEWLYSATAKSNLMVYLSELDNIKTSSFMDGYLIELFQKGVTKLKEKDIKMINDDRIKNKLEPFTTSEILAFVESLHDYCLSEKL